MKNTDYDYLYYPSPRPSPPVDWMYLLRLTPWLIVMTGWVVWFWYLAIPTFFGMHGTGGYPFENNLSFVLLGLSLMLVSQTMWRLSHTFRAILFSIVIYFLSYWF